MPKKQVLIWGIVLTLGLGIVASGSLWVTANSQPKIRWKTSKVAWAFWMKNGRLVTVVEQGKPGKYKVIDENGNNIWQLEKRGLLTEDLRFFLPDGTVQVLAPEDGKVIRESKYPATKVYPLSSLDSFTGIQIEENGQGRLEVYSKSDKLLWQYTSLDKNFREGLILPSGKVVVGFNLIIDREQCEIVLIDDHGIRKILKAFKGDASILSGEAFPIFLTNKKTGETLIVVNSSSWWGLISSTGEKIAEGALEGNIGITTWGNGFAYSYVGGDEVFIISDNGGVSKKIKVDGSIQGLSGNTEYLAISVGPIGYKGAILLFNIEGKLETSLEIPMVPMTIAMSDSSTLVLGVLAPSFASLYDMAR